MGRIEIDYQLTVMNRGPVIVSTTSDAYISGCINDSITMRLEKLHDPIMLHFILSRKWQTDKCAWKHDRISVEDLAQPQLYSKNARDIRPNMYLNHTAY